MKLSRYLLALITVTFTAALLGANPNDLNKDKCISSEKFEAFQANEAKKTGRQDEARQIEHLCKDKDRDGDGVLSYEELAKPVK